MNSQTNRIMKISEQTLSKKSKTFFNHAFFQGQSDTKIRQRKNKNSTIDFRKVIFSLHTNQTILNKVLQGVEFWTIAFFNFKVLTPSMVQLHIFFLSQCDDEML